MVRELTRDHGKHAVCHVGGVTAFACLFIEGAARFDIVGDIGDVHGKFPTAIIIATFAVWIFFDTDGVIKVLGIMRINGDHGQVSPVVTVLEVAFGDTVAKGLGLGQHVRGEFIT